jgi:RpiR family carbohydrate utilization transcriptional regulator
MSEATLLETISERRPQLRASEQKVAELILEDPVRAMDFNMAGLSDAAGVSEPTVMRFCSAIGFDGFRSFKVALVQAVALGLPLTISAIHLNDTSSDLAEKVFSHSISSLDRARRHLDTSAIEEAIELMAGASELIFVGAGASGIVALDAQQKFPLFGIPCQAPQDYHQQFIAASMSTPRTVTIVISNTGRTRTMISVAKAAKDAGGQVIAITGDAGLLSELADIEIRVSTFEDTDFYTPSVSRLAGLVVIDILATGVALRSGTEALHRVRVMKQNLAQMRGSEAYIEADTDEHE